MKKLVLLVSLIVSVTVSYSQVITTQYLEQRMREVSSKTYSLTEQKKVFNGMTDAEYQASLVLDYNMTIEDARYRMIMMYIDHEDEKAGREKTSIRLVKQMAEDIKKGEEKENAKREAKAKVRYEYFYKYFPELLSLYEKYDIVEDYLFISTYKMKSNLEVYDTINKELAQTFNWLKFSKRNIKDSQNASGVDDEGLYIYPNLEAFVKDMSEVQKSTELEYIQKGNTPTISGKSKSNSNHPDVKKYFEEVEVNQGYITAIKGYSQIKDKIESAQKDRVRNTKLQVAAEKAGIEAAKVAEIAKLARDQKTADSLLAIEIQKKKDDSLRITSETQKSNLLKYFPELGGLYDKYEIKDWNGVTTRSIIAVTNYGLDADRISTFNWLKINRQLVPVEETSSKSVDSEGYYVYDNLESFIKDLKHMQSNRTASFFAANYAKDFYNETMLRRNSNLSDIETVKKKIPFIYEYVDENFQILNKVKAKTSTGEKVKSGLSKFLK